MIFIALWIFDYNDAIIKENLYYKMIMIRDKLFYFVIFDIIFWI